MPGVADLLASMQAAGVSRLFCTNDNRAPLDAWAARLQRFGLDVEPEEIVTSATIAADYLARTYGDRPILALGDRGLIEAVDLYQLNRVGLDTGETPAVVVMGKAPDFDQTQLRTVCRHIWNGADFVATNNDPKMPVADGFIPGTGAMVQAIAYATGVDPLVTGKPSRFSGETVLAKIGLPAKNSLMVGDQISSDIPMGNRVGMRTVLVLTGTSSREDVARCAAEQRPTLILNDLRELNMMLFGGSV